jgi:hypothetical protein
MKRRARYFTALPVLLLAGSYAQANELPSFDAYYQAPAAAQAAAKGAATRSPGGFVASIDEQRGTPTFFWAQRGTALPAGLKGASSERIARFHLTQHADLYNLSPGALKTAKAVLVHDTGRGGIVVTFRQSIDGVDVVHSDMKVLMDRKGELVAIGGSLHPSAVAGATKKMPASQLNQIDAISRAMKDLYGVAPPSSLLRDLQQPKAGYDRFALTAPLQAGAQKISFARPARVKKIYYPLPGGLVPAYYLELQAGAGGQADSDVYAFAIAADDGRLLMRRNLVDNEAFGYRVWADTKAPYTPSDGPVADFTPHPTGLPDLSAPLLVAPALISMEGFNVNPNGVADPWLPEGATDTLGNNVDAYTDRAPTLNAAGTVEIVGNGFTPGEDLRASITSPKMFDRTYDLSLGPLVSTDQGMAATVQLFYTTNWMHDWWYASGFNEASGNAQMDNFGRGGKDSDPLLAEAQDAALVGKRNNANMATPGDGESPRMQMYVWSGEDDTDLDFGAPINAPYAAGSAAWGAATYDLTGEIVLVNDGVVGAGTPPGTVNDGCEVIAANLTGKIALVDRGLCGFVVKAKNAQNAGAIGIVIANNAANQPPVSPMGGSDPTVTIAGMSITRENGIALKAALQAAPITVHMRRGVGGVEHDGTIDNSIIAHEWGHYLHHRLVDCSGNVCGGMSEGWADFNALMMVVRPGDDLANGTFALTQYAGIASFNEGYYGIRRLPYTRDAAKNPFTFKHITDNVMLPNIPLGSGGANNAEVHNTGEIWSNMLFNAYADLQLQGGHTFDEAKRRMGDYVVAGMMLAPVNPTYTEQRDGVLAAAAASDMNDMLLIANAFASRGVGTCAESPLRTSTNNAGVVETYDLKGRHAFVSVKIDDSVKSCDSDGFLDGEEVGKVTIEMTNGGPVALVDTVATVLPSDPGVVLPNGDKVTFPLIGPFQTVSATVDIGLDNSFVDVKNLALSVEAYNDGSCIASVTTPVNPRVNLDDVVGISTTDTVDSDKSTWTLQGESSDALWTRFRDATLNYEWIGRDAGSKTDTSLESADIKVATNGNFVFTFDHKYEFETTAAAGANPAVYWDGGVIEITDDGGATWKDVSLFTSPGYGGTLSIDAENPIGGRQAYVNKNPAFPARNTVLLNLGTAFAGKTVKLRFRIGTDLNSGAPGWEIDNMGVLFVTNKPFSAVIADTTTCNGVPIADAGPDQTVMAGDVVVLDATKSSDPDNDFLTYSWKQNSGDAANLLSPATPTPVFIAPDVAVDSVLTFAVSVTDGKGSAGDTVDILVKSNNVGTGGAGGSGGSGGGSGGTAGSGGSGGGTGGTAGSGGSGGGTGGTGGGMGGEGGSTTTTTTTTSTTATTTTTTSVTGAGGSGGETDEGDCSCAVVGGSTAPVKPAVLASLFAMLGLWIRRGRRSKRDDAS